MEVVLLFPGQGSQKPGMGKDLYEAFPEAKRVFESADAALGSRLSALCFEGPADELTKTHNAQPALLVHGAAVWAVVRDKIGARVKAAAGHSLGELTAYHAAGSLTVEDAARLVRRRGELMYESGVKRPGTMAAILGDPTEPIEAICAKATADAGLVSPANYNCPGQVVISGENAGVDRAMELAKAAGAKRAIKLNVSGAFHSALMESALTGFTQAIDGAALKDPAFPVYANVNGEAVTAATRAKEVLLKQLTSPVQWIKEITAMAAAFPNATYVEMGPGSVLVGLVKKIAPNVRTMTCGTLPEVNQLLDLAA
ncbi:MAG TPA: ACP S-malonyltransferase [Gemmatimonadaceae bacterium]